MSDKSGILMAVFIVVIMCFLMFAIFSMIIPHGELKTETGYIEDVRFSEGGYMTPSATYIYWDNNTTLKLQGSHPEIRRNINASISYKKGIYNNFYVDVEYV